MKNLLALLWLVCLAAPALGQDNLIYPEQIDRRIWAVTPEFETYPTAQEIEDLRISPGDVINHATAGLLQRLVADWTPWPFSAVQFSASDITSATLVTENLSSEEAAITILNTTEFHSWDAYITNATAEYVEVNILNATDIVAGDVIINSVTASYFDVTILNATDVYVTNIIIESATTIHQYVTNATTEVAVTNILNVTEVTIQDNAYYDNTYVSDVDVFNTTNVTQILNYIFHELDDLVMNEEMAGAVDGSNRTFATARSIYNNAIDVYLLDAPDSYPLKVEPSAFVVSGTNTVTFNEAPIAVNPYTRQPITVEIYATYVTDNPFGE